MTDAQYQRLIGIIFLVGSGCASRPGIAGLFFLIGAGLVVLSCFPSRNSDSESSSDKPTGDSAPPAVAPEQIGGGRQYARQAVVEWRRRHPKVQ